MRVVYSGAPRPFSSVLCSAVSGDVRAPVAPPQTKHRQLLVQHLDVPAHPSYGQEPGWLWLAENALEATLGHQAASPYAATSPRRSLRAPAFEAAGAQPSAARLAALLVRGTFQVQLQDEPPQQRDKQKRADYYANVGDAIRALRDDIPLLFVKDLHYDIYREDMVFTQSTLDIKGLKNYKRIFWSLRFHGRLFFKRLTVDVVRIWQPEDSLIKMRWRVHGVPRVWWEEGETTFDGISTYKLDREGLIYEHKVDNVQLRDPPITNPVLYALNYLRPRMQPQQMPIPGSWFRRGVQASAERHACAAAPSDGSTGPSPTAAG